MGYDIRTRKITPSITQGDLLTDIKQWLEAHDESHPLFELFNKCVTQINRPNRWQHPPSWVN